jgi:hypothetical protein
VSGDSSYFCKAIEALKGGASVRKYTGVDLSGQALQIAGENLKSCLPENAEIDLVVDDMTTFLKVSIIQNSAVMVVCCCVAPLCCNPDRILWTAANM